MRSLSAYVGTYTDRSSDGIHVFDVDESTGALSRTYSYRDVENPSFLALSTHSGHIYAVNECETGRATAFTVEEQEGSIRYLNSVSSGGSGPCHCALDTTGQYLLLANYAGATVSVLPIADDGSLKQPSTVVDHTGSSVHSERQTEPHPHQITFGPNNRFVYVPDLGTDEVFVYKFDDSTGHLEHHHTVGIHEGAGPRHMAFLPTERHVILLNELDSTAVLFDWDVDTGVLTHVATVDTLPADFTGHNQCADIHVHVTGQWIYGSNRGHDSIVTMSVDPEENELEPVQWTPTGGEWPRNFGFDPEFRWLYALNQYSDTINIFGVGQKTGLLEPTDTTVDIAEPACIRFYG